MEWWQIVLIALGSIVVGTVVGIGLSYLVRLFVRQRFTRPRFTRKQFARELEAASVVEGQRHEVAPLVEERRREAASAVKKEEGHEEAISMVPLLGRRSIAVVAIGLVVGVGLGLGYWAVSPVEAVVQMGWPPVQIPEQPTLYKSILNVSIMTRGISYRDVKSLEKQGQYYVGRMNAFQFWDSLSQKIAEQFPQYLHSSEELDEMIRVRYDWNVGSPAIQIRAVSPDPGEAFFLASFIPQVFREYLYATEHSMKLERYQASLKRMETVKVALLEAEKELASLRLQEDVYDLSLDPAYIALNARVKALGTKLDIRADELANLIAEGDTGEGYRDVVAAIARTSTALSESRSELSNLRSQAAVDMFDQRLVYMDVNTKVDNLSNELDDLATSLVYLSASIANDEPLAVPNFYPAPEPSAPIVFPPERIRGRNAVMMGAVLGMGGAWAALNRKWLASSLQIVPGREEEEDNEGEA